MNTEQVSESKTRGFSSWQGNQWLARRHTPVRHKNFHDWKIWQSLCCPMSEGPRIEWIKRAVSGRKLVLPWPLTIDISRQVTSFSYPEIGYRFSDKHHSTIKYGESFLTPSFNHFPEYRNWPSQKPLKGVDEKVDNCGKSVPHGLFHKNCFFRHSL